MIDILIPVFVHYMPDILEEGFLYVSMEYEVAIHKCACGCGKEVVTPLSKNGWTISVKDNLVTLNPSIGNWQSPCKTHYFIRENKIQWC